MIPYIGDFAEDATIYHYFNTFDSNDPSASVTITNLADTDIYVYKDGSVTDIVTDGASVVIDFDSRTGVHKLTIDTSVDAAYAIGSDYMVLIEGTTIDSGTVTAGIFTFSIENRYNAAADDLANATDGLGALKVLIDAIQTDLDNGTDGLGAIKATADAIETDTQDLQTQVGTAGAGLTNIGTIATVTDLTNLPAITANWLTAAGTAADFTTEIQAGLATEAKQDIIDTNVDAILVDTSTTLDNHLTDIKGTGFVKDTHSLVDIEAYVDLIDDGTSGLAKIATDAAAILDDTGTNGVALLSATQASIDAIETDTGTTLPALLPDALVGGAIKADLLSISGSTTAADTLEASMLATISGTLTSFTDSTTVVDTGLTAIAPTDDMLTGRVIVFYTDTGKYEAARITAYTASSGTLTVTTLASTVTGTASYVIV